MKAQSAPSDAITPNEVRLIQGSFLAVQEQSVAAAARFFRELFSYDSSLRAHFAADPWSREEQLMTALRVTVEQLDSPQSLASHLTLLVQRFPAYALNNYYHLYFGASLFSMFEDVLGSRFNAAVYAAWFKVFERAVADVKARAAHVTSQSTPSFAHATAA